MKNIFISVLVFLSFGQLYAQSSIYTMGEMDFVTDCEGILYDDGGSGFPGFYSNQLEDDSQQITICPTDAGCVVMDFSVFITENTSSFGLGDILYAYDGPDSDAPLIGEYSGSLISSEGGLGRIIAGSGCLTLVFDENGSFSTVGWEANWTCFSSDYNCETQNGFGAPNDCVKAIVVSDDATYNYNSSGPGVEELNAQGIQGCITAGETQSFWVSIQIAESAPPNIPLTFTLSPKPGGEDYDFAIYGPNEDCGDLGTPIRCTYAEETFAGTLLTGLRQGETDVSETPTMDNEGNLANAFVAPILVNPGEQYYMIINHFSESSVGFDFFWGDEVLENNILDGSVCRHLLLMPNDFEVCTGESFEIAPVVFDGSGSFDYEWTASLEGLETSVQDGVLTVVPPDDFLGEISFQLVVSDSEVKACQQEKQVTVEVVSLEDCANTAENLTLHSLQIQPNPAHDFLQISLKTPKTTDASLQWYNAQGQRMATERVEIGAGQWRHSLEVADFSEGVYYLHLQTEEGVIVEKVLVFH